MYSPYSPLTSRKQLDNEFSKLRKLTYNAFRWWRMYDNPNKPYVINPHFVIVY